MVREIKIRPVYNGFVVTVGCQDFVFNSMESLVNHITNYYTNPDKYESKFLEDNKVNDTMRTPPDISSNLRLDANPVGAFYHNGAMGEPAR
jgi:hypothetical protein